MWTPETLTVPEDPGSSSKNHLNSQIKNEKYFDKYKYKKLKEAQASDATRWDISSKTRNRLLKLKVPTPK